MLKRKRFQKITAMILALSIVLSSVISGEIVFAAEKQETDITVIDITEYGGDPSGKEDNALAIQRAIEAAKEVDGSVILNFPKGEYHIYPDYSYKRDWYVSNTVGTDPSYKNKTIGVLLEDMKDVTLEGNDSLFMFHGKMTTFATVDCENVVFQNFSFDFQTPTVMDVTIEEIGAEEGSDYAIAYVPECYNYTIDGTNIIWTSDVSPYTGKTYWTYTNRMNYSQVYDLASGETWRGGAPIFDNVNRIEDLGSNRLKFIYHSRNSSIRPGLCYQMRNTTRDNPGTFIWQSKDVTMRNINAHFLHGFGMVGQFSENITYDNINYMVPENSGRTTAGFADFIQMSGCKGKVTINNCLFSNPHDDPINVHGTFLQVSERISDRKFKVSYKHNETGGFPNFYVGDEVEFATRGNMVPVENSIATVVEVEGPEEGSLNDIIITLDQDMPAEIGKDTHVVENITYTPEVEIKNNVFQSTPTRGILVTTRKPIVIENNYFDSMRMSGIYISNDAQGWYESGPVRDVVIRNNVFDKCASPVIYFDPTNGTVNADNPVHRNVLIEENVFNMSDGTLLSGKSVGDLTFQNNTIHRYDPNVQIGLSTKNGSFLNVGEKAKVEVEKSGNRLGSKLYSFNGCNQVVLKGNRYDGGLNTGVSLSNGMSNTEKYIDVSEDSEATVGTDHSLDPVGTIQYYSSNEEVAVVSEDGTVTAKADGAVEIIAYSILNERVFQSDPVVFYVGDAEINLPEKVTIVSEGDTLTSLEENMQFSAFVEPEDAVDSSVSWSVEDPVTKETSQAAEIDNNGLLTSKKNGVACVKATTVNGKTGTKLIAVVTAPASDTLQEKWNIVREDKSGWSFVEGKEALKITAQGGSLWATGNSVKNIILTDTKDGKDTIEATLKVSGKTKTNYEEAGIIFYQDDDNYVIVQRKHGAGNPGIFVVTEHGGSANEDGGLADIASSDVYYKLVKEGSQVTGFYSEDGEDWKTIRTVTNSGLGENFKIGLIAGGGNGSTSFVFSDFAVNETSYGFRDNNYAPKADQVTYTKGTIHAGEEISVAYQYTDADQDEEGDSVICWLASDTEEGVFEPLSELNGKTIMLPETLTGMYIKVAVIPFDARGKSGAIAYGAPMQVLEKNTAKRLIKDAQLMTKKLSSRTGLKEAAITGAEFEPFKKDQKYYVTTAKADQEQIDVSFQAESDQALIELKVNGKTLEKKAGSVAKANLPLIANHNIIEVRVTAENGIDKAYYRFVVMRTGYDSKSLTSIKVDGQLIEGFDKEQEEYVLLLDQAKSICIEATQEHSSSVMSITADGKRTEGNVADIVLRPGTNLIYFTVKPDTAGPNRCYTLRVKVADERNNNLESMTFGNGVIIKEAVSADTLHYTGITGCSQSMLEITAEDAGARINVKANGEEQKSIDNHMALPIEFYDGDNEIVIEIIAKNGDSKTYLVEIEGQTEIYADNTNWESATIGWGSIQIDKSVEGGPIKLKDKDKNVVVYEKGIGTHADSEIVFNVEGMGYTRFQSFVGVNADRNGAGSITFEVWVDDELAFRTSKELTSNDLQEEIDLDITGAKKIKLFADKGANDGSDHADWAEARFTTGLLGKERPIENPIEKIELDKQDHQMKIGEEYIFQVTYYPEDAVNKELTWNSSNESVAKVDASGKVTALSAGAAIITAKTSNDKTASCELKVIKKENPDDKKDQEAAKAVENLIANIGTVSYSNSSRDKINGARKAYDALSDAQKKLVKNRDVLEKAEKQYTLLKEKAEEIKQGKTYTVGKYKYKVTNLKKKTVKVVGVTNKKIKTIKVKEKVKIKGKTFKITAIGTKAFKNCKEAKKAFIGKNVKTIENNAFYGCRSLKQITIKGGKITTVKKKAFRGIKNGLTIKVPAKKVKYYKNLLKNKGLKKTAKIK